MQNLDAAFSALADPTRRAILARLALGEATVMELAEPFAMTQPAVSRHLKVLREAGLVTVEVRAQQRVYRLDPAPLRELDDWLAGYRGFWDQRLDALGTEIARGRRARRTSEGETP
jgi:DNA-binding transcriptional ArsR family regulator